MALKISNLDFPILKKLENLCSNLLKVSHENEPVIHINAIQNLFKLIFHA